MSLNHKRRIFRPGATAWLPSWRVLPSLGVTLAAVGGAATLLFAASFFVRPSEAPARAPVEGHILAGGDRLAVVDGDTLRMGDRVVRLYGIVAPARGSICQSDDHAPAGQPGVDQPRLDCGSAAANALGSLIRGKTVDCAIQGHDALGRPVGVCLAAGRSLSDSLVSAGWAKAGAADLHGSEDNAKAARRGIWHNPS